MNLFGGWLMSRKVKTIATNWDAYKQDFVANCDFIKFEDGLKMCISCTSAQLEAIMEYFNGQEGRSDIFWSPRVRRCVDHLHDNRLPFRAYSLY